MHFIWVSCLFPLQQLKHALGPDKPGLPGNGRVSWCRWAAGHTLSSRGCDSGRWAFKLSIVTKNLLTSLQNCTSNHIWISVPVLVEDGKTVSRSNLVLAGTKGITSQSCCFILWWSTPLLLKLKVYVLLLSYFPDADQMESMDTVSLQAVTLADGSTAYIQHDTKGSFSDGQIMDGQVIQLEDGSAAYVQHVPMPKAGK